MIVLAVKAERLPAPGSIADKLHVVSMGLALAVRERLEGKNTTFRHSQLEIYQNIGGQICLATQLFNM